MLYSDEELARLDFLIYKDPDCRDRYIVVRRSEWDDIATLQAEVARQGGMRSGCCFIGKLSEAHAFVIGYDYCANWEMKK